MFYINRVLTRRFSISFFYFFLSFHILYTLKLWNFYIYITPLCFAFRSLWKLFTFIYYEFEKFPHLQKNRIRNKSCLNYFFFLYISKLLFNILPFSLFKYKMVIYFLQNYIRLFLSLKFHYLIYMRKKIITIVLKL